MSISGFVGYFWLSFVDAMAWEHFLLSLCGRQLRFAAGSWNFDDVYHTFGP